MEALRILLSIVVILWAAVLTLRAILRDRQARVRAHERLVARCRSKFDLDPIEDDDNFATQELKQRHADKVLTAALLHWQNGRTSDQELLDLVGLAETCNFSTELIAADLPKGSVDMDDNDLESGTNGAVGVNADMLKALSPYAG